MEAIKTRFTNAGQGHVFTFWDQLNETEKQKLLDNLKGINVERSNNIFKSATSAKPGSAGALKPLPESSVDSLLTAPKEKVSKWRETGLQLISENKVAVILLAGGQGTRLGSSDPKGMYDIGLPSHKSLFQLQAERILGIQRIAQVHSKKNQVEIPWYIMTSGPTREATESFFVKNNFFGVKKSNVFFFNQGVLPAFTNDGKIYMENKYTPFTAPDGNGGIYAALRDAGVIADLEKRNVPFIHAYCVDNCLVKVACPTFIGYCVSKNADCGAKAVPKSNWNEQVGVICLKDEKFSVVEYSEISEETAKKVNEKGNLSFSSANIANHFYTLDFLKKIETFEDKLEYHIAKKKIKYVDLNTGEHVSPTSNNGIKLELFIFDVFPFTERMAVLETHRKEEFSPLKNAPGSKDGDSPDTSRADILAQHVRFAEKAGATVLESEGQPYKILEISPLISYEGEGLESLKGKKIVVLVLQGRYAGKKAVIVKQFDEGTAARPYPHAIVAGIERYPLKITRSMGAKRVAKRSRVKTFVKAVNYNHLMPTRYNLDIDLKSVVTIEALKDATQKITAKRSVKKLFEERYNSGKNKWFFQKLRF
ncbi:UDP-N-acetylglucosamine pyrophosphorylase [Clydaea vesicula]|uniref:60S ribosomal protein L27 n=1 Tax=Clydaea vesicula TaxID=447962 RepID=A0AAD5U8A8_9FUNG|nr:UDP-N-acetylglucosamine pyrophosphorylase [Clydaea vesicula]KAJ3397020.1 UDP-N-acetylglucosamine pyrophosphorylase [Lobulomyces angularis]